VKLAFALGDQTINYEKFLFLRDPSFALFLSSANEIRWNQQVTFERATASLTYARKFYGIGSPPMETDSYFTREEHSRFSFTILGTLLSPCRLSKSILVGIDRNFSPKQRAPMKSLQIVIIFTSRSSRFTSLAILVFTRRSKTFARFLSIRRIEMTRFGDLFSRSAALRVSRLVRASGRARDATFAIKTYGASISRVNYSWVCRNKRRHPSLLMMRDAPFH